MDGWYHGATMSRLMGESASRQKEWAGWTGSGLTPREGRARLLGVLGVLGRLGPESGDGLELFLVRAGVRLKLGELLLHEDVVGRAAKESKRQR